MQGGRSGPVELTDHEDEGKGDPGDHGEGAAQLLIHQVPDIFVPRLAVAALDINLLVKVRTPTG